MSIELKPSTETDIRSFAPWRYEPPYDVYDIAESPDEAVAYFLRPSVRCHTLWDGSDIVGYATFGEDAQVPGGDYDISGIDIGLGIKPAKTGLGAGRLYVAAVVTHAAAMFGHRQLRVTIAAGNSRALHVWSGAGFVEISRFTTSRTILGSREFAILALEPTLDGAA